MVSFIRFLLERKVTVASIKQMVSAYKKTLVYLSTLEGCSEECKQHNRQVGRILGNGAGNSVQGGWGH